jgi:hypothetical protein
MSGVWHGGKGSKSRKVDQKAFSDNWDKIFGKKDMKFATAEDYMEAIEGNEIPETEEEAQARLRVHNQ